MGVAIRVAYGHQFVGWIVPVRSRRVTENKAFCVHRSAFSEKYIVSKMASC